jgi:hypothetical protein
VELCLFNCIPPNAFWFCKKTPPAKPDKKNEKPAKKDENTPCFFKVQGKSMLQRR